jgi:hypothetical protein
MDINENVHYVAHNVCSLDFAYWYNLNDGKAYFGDDLKTLLQLPTLNEADMFGKGYIVFPSIAFVDVQKKFIVSLNDKRLAKRLSLLSGEDFSTLFWKYVDDGNIMLNRWYNFLDNEKANSLIVWCNENSIKYKCEK